MTWISAAAAITDGAWSLLTQQRVVLTLLLFLPPETSNGKL